MESLWNQKKLDYPIYCDCPKKIDYWVTVQRYLPGFLTSNIVYANACYILGAVTVDYSSFVYFTVQDNRYKL